MVQTIEYPEVGVTRPGVLFPYVEGIQVKAAYDKSQSGISGRDAVSAIKQYYNEPDAWRELNCEIPDAPTFGEFYEQMLNSDLNTIELVYDPTSKGWSVSGLAKTAIRKF